MVCVTDSGFCFVLIPKQAVSAVHEVVPTVSPETGAVLKSRVYLVGDGSPFLVQESVEEILQMMENNKGVS